MKKPAKPKAKRGRPPKPDGAMTIYKVRLSRDDVRALDRLAKRLKSTRSAAIRHAIQKAVEGPTKRMLFLDKDVQFSPDDVAKLYDVDE